MTAFNFTRRLLPAVSALALLAAPALAQSTSAPASGGAMAPTTSSPAASNSMAPSSMAPTSMTPATSKSKPMTSMKLPASEEFKTTALASAHCPGDTVVWSTLSRSKSYHLASSKYYGKTKHGAYVCEKDATAAGFHASKS